MAQNKAYLVRWRRPDKTLGVTKVITKGTQNDAMAEVSKRLPKGFVIEGVKHTAL